MRSAQCAVQHIEHRREHWVHWVWPRRPSRQMSTGSKKSLIRSARNGHISPFHQNFSTYVNICEQFDWKALKGSGWSDWISAIMLRKFACHAWSTDGIGWHGHGHSTVTALKFRFETSQFRLSHMTFTRIHHGRQQDSTRFWSMEWFTIPSRQNPKILTWLTADGYRCTYSVNDKSWKILEGSHKEKIEIIDIDSQRYTKIHKDTLRL